MGNKFVMGLFMKAELAMETSVVAVLCCRGVGRFGDFIVYHRLKIG